MQSVNLTDEELVLLDGKCSSEVQESVNSAKSRFASIASMPDVNPELAKWIADSVEYAKKKGRIRFCFTDLRSCPICKTHSGYYVHARTTRNHRKGEVDTGRPKYRQGVDLSDDFVIIKGYPSVGCCMDCWVTAKTLLAKALDGTFLEIPEGISGVTPVYKRENRRKCKTCGWEGHEGEMGKLPALMEGYYPGQCPKCGAKETIFTTQFDHLPGFSIVHNGQEVYRRA